MRAVGGVARRPEDLLSGAGLILLGLFAGEGADLATLAVVVEIAGVAAAFLLAVPHALGVEEPRPPFSAGRPWNPGFGRSPAR